MMNSFVERIATAIGTEVHNADVITACQIPKSKGMRSGVVVENLMKITKIT
jgi:hypothetical protein